MYFSYLINASEAFHLLEEQYLLLIIHILLKMSKV